MPLLIIQLLLLLGGVALTGYYFGYDANPDHLLYPISTIIVLNFFWTIGSWRLAGNRWFDPYVLFTLAATLFNAGFAFLVVVDARDENLNYADVFEVYELFSLNTVVEALLLVLVGLVAFHLGALLCTLFLDKRFRRMHVKPSASNDLRRLRQVGWGMFAISVLPTALLFMDVLPVVLRSSYAAGWIPWSAPSAPLRIAASFFVPSILFLIAGGKGKRKTLIVATLSLLLYSGLYFFIGARRLAAMPIIAALWIWHRRIRPLPTGRIALLGGALLFILFPIVGFSRKVKGADRLNFAFFIEQYTAIDNPIVAIVAEMGRAFTTVAYTLELVPVSRPFDWGSSYAYAVFSLFPNLFWTIHPAAERKLADWLVWTVKPAFAELGGGLGFSFIGESYLNFGWVGAPLVLAILGLMFARIVLWAERTNDAAKIATVASFLSFFLLFARGEAYMLPRNLVWYCLLPYLVVRLLPPIHLSRLSARFDGMKKAVPEQGANYGRKT